MLAARLGRRLVDTDNLIENNTDLTIPQIFERYGEEYFRDLESEVIAGLNCYPPGDLVVSTGGGAVIRETNRKHFFKQGIVVLLTASTETILERVRSTGGRPLLEGGKLKEKVESLWAEREPYYRQCHLEVNTAGRLPEETAAEIIGILGL
ncbi:MAG TPA: shikimate kinase [Firmicutes bacterium]|nr:shikimate kinase [Bacillota bacterium]